MTPVITSALPSRPRQRRRYLCGFCGRELAVQRVKDGRKNAKKPYISCNAPHQELFFRWVPKSDTDAWHAYTSIAFPLPPSSGTATAAPGPAPAKPECEYDNCDNTNVNRNCEQRQCKRHCISSGGCRCRGHHAPLQPAPGPLTSFLDGIAAVAASSFPPPPTAAAGDLSEQEKKFRLSHPHWFTSPSPSPPRPSPFPVPFTLVDFSRTGKPGTVHQMQASTFDWVRPGDKDYDVYSPDFIRWMPVEAQYIHNLRQHRRLLIRTRDVIGSDQDRHIAMLLSDIENDTSVLHSPPPPRPLRHPSFNKRRIDEEFSATVSMGKKRRIESESSNEEIEVSGYQAPPPQRPRPRLSLRIPSSSSLPSSSLPALSPASAGPSTSSVSAGPSTPTYRALPLLDSSPIFPKSIPFPESISPLRVNKWDF